MLLLLINSDGWDIGCQVTPDLSGDSLGYDIIDVFAFVSLLKNWDNSEVWDSKISLGNVKFNVKINIINSKIDLLFIWFAFYFMGNL